MMCQTNRIFSIFILLIIILNTLFNANVFASEDEEQSDPKYNRAVSMLTVLNIIKQNQNYSADFEKEVTRAEFSQMMVATFGLTDELESTGNNDNFTDVDPNYWAAGSIYSAVKLGLIKGFEDRTFRPEDSVSYEQALKMIVCALGYGLDAEQKGGFPTGYLIVAQEKGITKNVDAHNDAAVKRGDAALLIFNSLDVDIMKQTLFGNDQDKYSISKGKTLLSEKLKVIKKENGQVTATNVTMLSSPDSLLKEDQVEIDGTVFYIGNTQAKDLLGHVVDYYYKEEEQTGNKILLEIYQVDGKNDLLSLEADNILDYANRKLTYWADKEKDSNTRTARISGTADIIVNGRASTKNVDELFLTETTKINMLDTNNDEIYDVVFLNVYLNYIVDRIDFLNKTIYEKYDQIPVQLDPEDTEKTFTIMKDGDKIALSDIKEWDALMVSCDALIPKENENHQIVYNADGKKIYQIDKSNAKNIDIIVSDETVDGTVSELGDNKVTINDTQYKISESYRNAREDNSSYAQDINVDSSGTFYLNADKQIVAVQLSYSEENYGILANMGTKKGISSRVQFKIFTVNGEMKVFYGADTIHVNDISIKGDEFYNKVKNDPDSIIFDSDNPNRILWDNGVNRQLVKYRLNNDGELSHIYTAVSSLNTDKNIVANKDKFSLDYSNTTEDDLSGGITYRSNGGYSTFKSKYSFNSKSKIMFFPMNNNATDAEYGITNQKFFSADNQYKNIELYDITTDFDIGIVVIKLLQSASGGASSVVTIDQPIAVVDKVVYAINDQGETVYKVLGYIGNKPMEVLTKNQDIYDNDLSFTGSVPVPSHVFGEGRYDGTKAAQLQRGDVIQYTIDKNGYMDGLRVICRGVLNQGDNYWEKQNGWPIDIKTGTYAVNYVAYGKVNDKHKNFLMLTTKGALGDSNRRIQTNGTTTVLRYDSKKGKIVTGSFSDINEGNYIITQLHYDLGTVIFVIK